MRLSWVLSMVLGVAGCASLDPYDDGVGSLGSSSASSGGKTAAANASVIDSDWRLPWSCGERYYVSQGNDGDLCKASNGDHVQLQAYSWDFALPRHTPVRAARDGMVTLAVNVQSPGDECYDGCRYTFGSQEFTTCCKSCLLLSNRVNVQHADGTVSTYWHLDEATVSAGQHVRAGDLLGYSGTSGCSTGPHLHFQVMGDCPRGYCQSKNVQFAEAGAPACGDRISSTNACN